MKSIILCLILCIPELFYAQISFESSTNAESILQGSSFQLTYTLKNAESNGFRPPDFSPFQILNGPSRSMQTTIINGSMSSSVGFVYTLSCNQVGTFTIPPASVSVNGKILQSRPVTIRVVKATATATSGADVFIRAIAEKQEVYYGEQFQLTYKLYTRVNIQNIEFASKPALDAFQEENISVNNAPVQREIYEGREYTTKILSKSVLYPVKTGTITIDPLAFRISKGENDPWGMGMPSFFRSQVENIVSNELKIKVKEIPQPFPDHFSGAIGTMYVQMNPVNKSYTLNDAIHLGIQIQGDANFNMIKTDFIRLDSSFEISDSKSGEIIKVTDEPKMIKTRKYDYLIVPKSVGDFLIKPEFIYFNPSQNRYERFIDSFPVHIIAGNAVINNREDKDISDISHDVQLLYHSTGLLSDYRSWIAICFPIGILLFGLYKKNENRFFNSKHLKNRSDIQFSNAELNIAYLENLLMHKLLSRYHLSEDTFNLTSAKQFLQGHKENDDAASRFLQIIQQLEWIKYSGTASDDSLNQLKQTIEMM